MLTISRVDRSTFATQFCRVPYVEHISRCNCSQICYSTIFVLDIANQWCRRWWCCIRCRRLRWIVIFQFNSQIFSTSLFENPPKRNNLWLEFRIRKVGNLIKHYIIFAFVVIILFTALFRRSIFVILVVRWAISSGCTWWAMVVISAIELKMTNSIMINKMSMGKWMLCTNLDCGDARSFCIVSASVGAVDDALLDGLWRKKIHEH